MCLIGSYLGYFGLIDVYSILKNGVFWGRITIWYDVKCSENSSDLKTAASVALSAPLADANTRGLRGKHNDKDPKGSKTAPFLQEIPSSAIQLEAVTELMIFTTKTQGVGIPKSTFSDCRKLGL